MYFAEIAFLRTFLRFPVRLSIALIPFIFNGLKANADTFLVTNTNDSGDGSLRQAIFNANGTGGTDSIHFQIPGTGPFSIGLLSALFPITQPTIIDGTTQPGYAGKPLIEINGANTDAATSGFLLNGGGTTIKGLSINRFKSSAILITSFGDNVIQGNFLGIGLYGTNSLGNGNTNYISGGIAITQSINNLIGGLNAADRNVISGSNVAGIYISGATSTGNQILGNFIGTDFNGTTSLGNAGNGIVIASASRNYIGGTNAGSRNVISGNKQSGIYLLSASNNFIQGNLIGTDLTGKIAISNNVDGITLYQSPRNLIGGTNNAKNLISGNGQEGINLFGAGTTGNQIQGNLIGTDISGTNALGNGLYGIIVSSVSSNLIGGNVSGARNIISGNKRTGIFIEGTNASLNMVQGNFIGVDLNGTKALPNQINGISISGLRNTNNLIGGTSITTRNVISGNTLNGVFITGNSSGNQVMGNFIGSDVGGRLGLANGAAGIWIESPFTVIGGTTASTRNIISGNIQNGIYLSGITASNNLIQGNFIGTDVTGTLNLSNRFSGITLTNAPRNTIGGTAYGAGNLISGNNDTGVVLQSALSSGNQIMGNLVGTDISGSKALPNRFGGVYFYGAPTNTIGGTNVGAGNLISGNLGDGIWIRNAGAVGNQVLGNSIGIKKDGSGPLGNLWQGVEISDTSSNNIIGGAGFGAGNQISYSQTVLYAGVRIRDGCTGNLIRGNSIFGNAQLGIDLGTNGVTFNDLADLDSGANNLQNFPVLSSASGRYLTTIQGTLNSTPNQTFAIDFYANSSADPTGYGEGQVWLGFLSVTTSVAGNVSFAVLFTNTVPVNPYITATATDSKNNTSEFSQYTIIPTNTISADSDGDGMPDDFETAAGFNPNNANDANLDFDGDGMSNFQEFAAATDPLNASSMLKIISIEKTATTSRFIFPSVIGKTYQMEFTPAFPPIWSLLPGATNITGSGFIIPVIDNAPSATNRYYRLKVL